MWLLRRRCNIRVANLLEPIPASSSTARYTHQASSFQRPPKIMTLVTPEDVTEARSWVSWFKGKTLPRGTVRFTFTRSSGPGGQNVNKLNTKAELRCHVDAWWVPAWAHSALKASPYYITSTNTILITSSTQRSQAQNVQDCLSKLHTLVLAASSAPIRNEPTEEQKRRVATLERAEKARRREQKSYHSTIKKNRTAAKKGGWD